MRHNPYDQRAPCRDGGYDSVIRVPERDHAKLDNRDAEDAHPIKAISGLTKELDGLVSKTGNENVLSILEIDEILSR